MVRAPRVCRAALPLRAAEWCSGCRACPCGAFPAARRPHKGLVCVAGDELLWRLSSRLPPLPRCGVAERRGRRRRRAGVHPYSACCEHGRDPAAPAEELPAVGELRVAPLARFPLTDVVFVVAGTFSGRQAWTQSRSFRVPSVAAAGMSGSASMYVQRQASRGWAHAAVNFAPLSVLMVSLLALSLLVVSLQCCAVLCGRTSEKHAMQVRCFGVHPAVAVPADV
jgi:hypothetical protein